MKMTHRERFLHDRWIARREAKLRAKRLARQARQIDPQAKPTDGFWPGMYEGVPQPKPSKKLPFYQERALKSVGYTPGISKTPRKEVKWTYRPGRPIGRKLSDIPTALKFPNTTPIASSKPISLARDLSSGEAVITPHAADDRSQAGSITSGRENQ